MTEIHFLGHSFFKIAFNKVNVLIDPYIESKSNDPNFKRLVPCAANEKKLKDIALILVSHEHFDHCDKKVIERLAQRDSALVVATQNVLNELGIPQNLGVPVQGHDKKTLRGINIEINPVHHPHSFYPISFLLEKNGQRIYHAGDTSLVDSFEEIKANICLFPIGGTYTMDVVDAVKATKVIKPEIVIPMHYNTFGMIKADTREFAQKINKSILKTKPVVLKPGQKIKV